MSVHIESMVAANKLRPWVEIQGRHMRVVRVDANGLPTTDDWSGWFETEDAAWEAARRRLRELDGEP